MNFLFFTLRGFIGILNGFHPVMSDSPNTQINRLKVASHSSFIKGEEGRPRKGAVHHSTRL